MKRNVGLMAVVLTFCFCFVSLAVAGPKEGKGGKKQTVLGTITQVNQKAKTITVKPMESGEQVQTQQDLQQQQDNQPAKPAQRVFQVDDNIVIKTANGAQQDQEQTKAGSFELLQSGQTVRVVFQVTQEQQQQAQGQQNQGQQDQGQEGKKRNREKGKQPAKQMLRALSIEILKDAAQRQQEK